MLKIMLNRIVKIYGGSSLRFSLLRFYGLQIYGKYFKIFIVSPETY